MRILITGGAGFVGRHLVRTLVAGGDDVVVLDTLSAQVHGPAARVPSELAGAEWLHGDIRDEARLTAALDGVDAVVHLAAETGVGQSMYDVERYVEVNELGTACLLQALVRRQQPVRFVLASSRAVYGEGLYHCARCGEVAPAARPPEALQAGIWDPCCPRCGAPILPIATHEDAPLQPGSVYAATKQAQESLCRIVGNAYGWSVTILRYFNVYGPGQSLSNPYTGILSAFTTRARHGKTIEVFEDGEELRDFVYIDDVVAATQRAVQRPPSPHQTQVINVGTGQPVSVRDLAQALLAVGGWEVPVVVTGACRVGDVRHAFADTQRLRRVLGLSELTPLTRGLERWLAWAEARLAEDATDAANDQLAARGLYLHARSA